MVKSYGVVGGILDYNDSFLGQVIVIVISRPRSLTILVVFGLEVRFLIGWSDNVSHRPQAEHQDTGARTRILVIVVSI